MTVLVLGTGCASNASSTPAPSQIEIKNDASASRAASFKAAALFPPRDSDVEVLGPSAARYTVLSFGASGCVPCWHEWPLLVARAKAWRERGVDVYVVVSEETTDNQARLTDYFSRQGAEGLALLHDADGRIADAFEVDALPTTLLLDREGRVLLRREGMTATLMDDLAQGLRASSAPSEKAGS